ncbi:MAG: hypothetical protein HDT22_03635 [Ruminococcus sp.]|nr:hypothetical protein [Ruminococcus sp.]
MIAKNFLTGDSKTNLMLLAIMILLLVCTCVKYVQAKARAKKDREILKNMYANHSVRITAKILEIQKFSRKRHLLCKIKVGFHDRNVYKTCIVKTSHSKIRDYEINQELQIFIIPEYIAYQEKHITKKQLFQELGLKFDVSRKATYRPALIEEDYYHIIENF